MSLVNLINVIVNNPQARFEDPIGFDIFFESLQPLEGGKCPPPLLTFVQSLPGASFTSDRRPTPPSTWCCKTR